MFSNSRANIFHEAAEEIVDRLVDSIRVADNGPNASSHEISGLSAEAFLKCLQAAPKDASKCRRTVPLNGNKGERSATPSERSTTSMARATQSTASPLHELPVDVFFVLATHLHPRGLLNLARTSKPLRATLLSRKRSRHAWRASLSTVADLPACPEDLSEPMYTALIFDSHCFACASPDAYSVDYALRVRLCGACFEENVGEGRALLKDASPEVRQVCMAILPCEDSIVPEEPRFQKTLHRINPFTHTLDDFYFKPQVDAVVEQLSCVSLADCDVLQDIVFQRVQEICVRKIHSVLLRTWENMVQCGFVPPSIALKDSLHLHIKDFGFVGPLWLEEDEDEVMRDDAASNLEDIGPQENVLAVPFVHLNPGTVFIPWRPDRDNDELEDTPSTGSSGQPTTSTSKDITQIAREQAARTARNRIAYKVRLARRFAQMEDIYERLFHAATMVPDTILPNKYDGARLLTVLAKENDARGDVSPDRFVAFTPRLMFAVKASHMTFRAEVAALVPPRGPDEPAAVAQPVSDEKPQVLDRADAFFACTACGDGLQPYPEIHTHWKDVHTDESCWDWTTAEPRPRVAFWTPGVQLVEDILAAADLPEDIEMPELDRLIGEGRLFCSCGDPVFPTTRDAECIGWSDFVMHIYEHQVWYNYRCRVRPSRVEDESLVLNNDHELSSCIKLLPENATNEEKENAKHLVHADEVMRARIDAHLAQCPEDAIPICRICDMLTLESKRDISLTFQMDDGADRIVYHMRRMHSREFEEANIVFDSSKAVEQYLYLQQD